MPIKIPDRRGAHLPRVTDSGVWRRRSTQLGHKGQASWIAVGWHRDRCKQEMRPAFALLAGLAGWPLVVAAAGFAMADNRPGSAIALSCAGACAWSPCGSAPRPSGVPKVGLSG
jgi:hypothetical protein